MAVSPKTFTENSSCVDESTCLLNSFASVSSRALFAEAAVAVGRHELVGQDVFEEREVFGAERRVPVPFELDEDLLIGSNRPALGRGRRRHATRAAASRPKSGSSPGHINKW